MTMPVRCDRRRSFHETVCAGIVVLGVLLLISSPVAAPTDHQAGLLPGPWPVELSLMPYPELSYRLTARRDGAARPPAAVPFAAVPPLEFAWLHPVNRLDVHDDWPLPADLSWDLAWDGEEHDRLETYLDILGFSGLGTPAADLPPPLHPEPGPGLTFTTESVDMVLKMTAIAFLIAVIMVPGGCAIVARILYINPRDGPRRLDAWAGQVAPATAYPVLSSCL